MSVRCTVIAIKYPRDILHAWHMLAVLLSASVHLSIPAQGFLHLKTLCWLFLTGFATKPWAALTSMEKHGVSVNEVCVRWWSGSLSRVYTRLLPSPCWDGLGWRAPHFYTKQNDSVKFVVDAHCKTKAAFLSCCFVFCRVWVGWGCFCVATVWSTVAPLLWPQVLLTRWRTLPSPPRCRCASARRTVSCWSFFFWLPRSQPASCNALHRRLLGD